MTLDFRPFNFLKTLETAALSTSRGAPVGHAIQVARLQGSESTSRAARLRKPTRPGSSATRHWLNKDLLAHRNSC